MKLIISFLIAALGISNAAYPCTNLLWKSSENVYFGNNFDWTVGNGSVITNPRGIQKTSINLDSTTGTSWTSKYGSITFNQVGWDFPYGGMNELGVVVGVMLLAPSTYPAANNPLPSINELQWVQYILDLSSSAAEARELMKQVRIQRALAPLHYLVCDSTGDCSVVEYLNHKLQIYSGDTLPYKVVTNDTYKTSLETLSMYQGFGGSKPIPQSGSSLDRFARAVSLVTTETKADVSKIFGILDSVQSQAKFISQTQWTLVYDINAREIHYKSAASRTEKTIAMRDFNFNCKGGFFYTDIHQAPNFQTLDWAANDGILALNSRWLPKTVQSKMSQVGYNSINQCH